MGRHAGTVGITADCWLRVPAWKNCFLTTLMPDLGGYGSPHATGSLFPSSPRAFGFMKNLGGRGSGPQTAPDSLARPGTLALEVPV